MRKAFRELALHHHPDRAGPEQTQRFQEIVTAYEVLSDPSRRASYDREISEPRLHDRPISLVDDFEVTEPSLEEVFDRLMRSFTMPWWPKSQHRDVLPLEIEISPAQAASGGIIAIDVPVFGRCRGCRGAGHHGFFICRRCDGRGVAPEERPLEISLAPGVRDGSSTDVVLDDFGVPTIVVRIIIRIAEQHDGSRAATI